MCYLYQNKSLDDGKIVDATRLHIVSITAMIFHRIHIKLPQTVVLTNWGRENDVADDILKCIYIFWNWHFIEICY